MIKKIHQFCKTNELEDYELQSQNRLIELNPDYEYKLWTTDGDELKNLFSNKYPEVYDLWDKIKGIQRADIGRYFVLYLEGGFYCDTDFYINESLNSLGELKETYFSPSIPDFLFMDSGFTNYFMYSPGKDSFFLDVIKEALNRIRETNDYNQPSYISYTTGKILLNKLVKDHNYKVNIFSGKKVIDMSCECTKTDGYFGYHNGGTSRPNKKNSWLNKNLLNVLSLECKLRKFLHVRGNICQIPVLLISFFILFLIGSVIFYKKRSKIAKKPLKLKKSSKKLKGINK